MNAEAIRQKFLEKLGDKPQAAAWEKLLSAGQLWEFAKTLGAYYNTPEGAGAAPVCRELISAVRELQGEKARTSAKPTTVVFGTSGWRGVIGEDFTLLNVQKVVHGIIEMMKSRVFLDFNGYRDFSEVQRHGIVLLRDNRYLGELFIDAAAKVLGTAGIKVLHAGCARPVSAPRL